jgi:hypothetical protein
MAISYDDFLKKLPEDQQNKIEAEAEELIKEYDALPRVYVVVGYSTKLRSVVIESIHKNKNNAEKEAKNLNKLWQDTNKPWEAVVHEHTLQD